MSFSKTPKYLNDKDPWMLAEDIPDCDIFFFQIPMSCFASDTSYRFLKNYKKVLVHYKKFHMDFYFGEKDSYLVAESIFQALLKRPLFGREVNENIVVWSYKLIAFAKALSQMPLQDYSNRRLWTLYKQHDEVHTKLYTYGWLPVAVDMFHNNLTKNLKSYLGKICESRTEAESAFVALTTPTKKSIIAKEREEFLRIYKKYRKFLNHPHQRLKTALITHQNRWGHLGYIFAGNVNPFDRQHYWEEMKELAKTKIDADEILEKENQQLKAVNKRKEDLYESLEITALYKNLFENASDFALTKLIRRHAQLFAALTLHKTLLSEIARRLQLTRFQVQFMLQGEVKTALLENRYSRKIINARLKECVLYTEKDFEAVYIGSKVKKITSGLKQSVKTDVKELVGQIAQPGLAKGKVKIIIRAKDMAKMQKGDILVSIATDPDIVPAMKKAAAIVTEQGGITSHAAIVSRELGIPCIIGTKIATKVFKDGDLVEVNASHGWVRKIK